MAALVAGWVGVGTDAPPSVESHPTAHKPIPATKGRDSRAAALLAKLPERGPRNRKTSDYWVDDGGVEHGPLVSGQDDGYREAVEVLRALGLAPDRGELWVAAHVEVKLAARLRGTGERHVTLVINNVPCGEGKWSCDALLPRVLGPGQTVTIHWPDGKRTYWGEA